MNLSKQNVRFNGGAAPKLPFAFISEALVSMRWGKLATGFILAHCVHCPRELVLASNLLDKAETLKACPSCTKRVTTLPLQQEQ
ncbi:hypothetical protein T4E_7752 [Trichinella pseudospiralis]|uniref:Uncharacterized protein n=1 Tax=Trichinella pseudospiralis TaxID=6337 RepID=A0A0V1G3C1_TRIPS|nr:hypothetical protein T4E_7752 [Trichinella pseudospiralis]KRY92823.1 hypothetical protein T4D_4432 [Trichinella pseudospiralis]